MWRREIVHKAILGTAARLYSTGGSNAPVDIDEIAKALTLLRRDHQHNRIPQERQNARQKALALFPDSSPADTITTKHAWVWLNNAVYFHCDYARIAPYITWVLDNSKSMDETQFPAIVNSFSHIFREQQLTTGSPVVRDIPVEMKEKVRLAFEGDFLKVAIEHSSKAMNFIETILLLSGFSRMGIQSEKLYANLGEHIKKAIPTLKFTELANVAASLSKVKAGSAELFELMLPRARATVATGSPKDVSMLGNAFIKCNVIDTELFELAAVIMAGRALKCRSYELAGLISTFSKAHISNVDTLNTLVLAATKCLDRFSRAEICFVLPAISKFPVKSAPIFEGLAHRVANEIASTLRPAEAQALFCAYAKCDSRMTRDTLKVLLLKVQEHNEAYGPKEVMSLIDGLTRLLDVFTRAEINAMYKIFEVRALQRLAEGGCLEMVSFISMMSRDPDSFKIMPQLAQMSRTSLQSHVGALTPQTLAVLLTALIKPGTRTIMDESVTTSILPQCEALLPQCKAVELAAILAFLTCDAVHGAEAFTKVALGAVAANISKMTPVELSTTANILSRMSIPAASSPALWEEIDRAASAFKSQLTATQIGGIMSAFVRVEITPTNFFKQIVDVIVSKHSATLTPHELCEILGAYSKRGHEEDTIFASLAERVSQVAPITSPHEFATILYSFAKFDIRNEIVFYDYLPRVLKLAHMMKPSELSTVVVAYARVGVWNLKVFNALSIRMKEILTECSTQDIASVLNAFSKMDMQDEGFFLSCGDRIVSIASQCSVREMVSILHAFHEVDFSHDALLNEFLTRLSNTDVVAKAPLGDCCFIATSMPKARVNGDARLVNVYELLAARFIADVDMLTPTAIAGILHAYYRKRIEVPSGAQMYDVLTLRAAATVDKFHIRNLAMLLGAVTKSHTSKGVSLPAFIPRLLQLIPHCNAHNIMTVSTAFLSESEGKALFEDDAHEKISEALSRRTTQLLPTLRAYELAWIVRNLCMLNAAGGALEAERGTLLKMLDRVKSVHQQFSGKDCGNLLRVCAILGVSGDDEIVTLLCNRAVLTVANTPPRGVAECLDSLRMLNKSVPEYLTRVSTHLEKSKEFSQAEDVKKKISEAFTHFGVVTPNIPAAETFTA